MGVFNNIEMFDNIENCDRNILVLRCFGFLSFWGNSGFFPERKFIFCPLYKGNQKQNKNKNTHTKKNRGTKAERFFFVGFSLRNRSPKGTVKIYGWGEVGSFFKIACTEI